MLVLLTGFLWAWALATFSMAGVCVHRRAAPGPRLRAANEYKDRVSPQGLWAPGLNSNSWHNPASHQCIYYQQKGWKSVNLAQPFSSEAKAPAAHTLEPTSLAAPGTGAAGITGSSKTAVHAASVRRRCSGQAEKARAPQSTAEPSCASAGV